MNYYLIQRAGEKENLKLYFKILNNEKNNNATETEFRSFISYSFFLLIKKFGYQCIAYVV